MKALILAAGRGTRLGALTAATPKPMLPVGGVPLLGRTLTWLSGYGITQVAINLHHAAQVITDHVGDGSRYGVQVTWSYEETLLGTAGAAKRLQSFLDERFVVVYGDVFMCVDLERVAAFHTTHGVQSATQSSLGDGMTMLLYRVANPTECGLVEIDEPTGGRVRRFVEKPPALEVFTDLANAGLYICEPGLLQCVPAGQEYDFGRDLLPARLAAGAPTYGLPLAPGEFVIDIGTPAGLARAEAQAAALPTPRDATLAAVSR
ncbi:MAG: nucleotidyltransferase family protein [Caldilineaceae bacterium]